MFAHIEKVVFIVKRSDSGKFRNNEEGEGSCLLLGFMET